MYLLSSKGAWSHRFRRERRICCGSLRRIRAGGFWTGRGRGHGLWIGLEGDYWRLFGTVPSRGSVSMVRVCRHVDQLRRRLGGTEIKCATQK